MLFGEPDSKHAGSSRSACETHGQDAGFYYDMHGQNAGISRVDTVKMLELWGFAMTCTVNMPEFQGLISEPDSDNAAAMRFLVNHTGKMLELLSDMHDQNAGDSSFFCNKWLSFRPVAHRNRPIWLVAILSWVFSWWNRGSSTRPGLESVAAATGKTEICKKYGKLQK